MRAWTKSACVVLAWSILPIILVAVSMKGSVHPAQANTRTASSTEVILTSTLSVAAAPLTATTHNTKYVVRSGDTLSAIAVRFAVRGGWLALYAANRQSIGPDPNVIHTGTVLVLPGLTAPIHYTVAAGDTLSGIAARFAVRGGWPVLYAANRRAVGTEPNVIHAGTVLTIPRLVAPSPPTLGRALRRERPPAPPLSPPTGPRHHRLLMPARVPPASGMPQWLKAVLVAIGLLILGAFLAEPVLVVRGRQRAAAREAAAQHVAANQAATLAAAAQQAAAQQATAQAVEPGTAGPRPGCWRASALRVHVVVADYHRLVVTRSKPDDTIYVLRPPGVDPKAILRVARVVLPEGPYGELAKQLGMPAIGPVE